MRALWSSLWSLVRSPLSAGLAALPVALAWLLALPVLAVVASALDWSAQSQQVLGALASTVLPAYAGTSALLCAAVGLGVALVGGSTAVAVALFEFPGRRFFSWALLLPLAVPAYVVAYAYTDQLQYAGPVQSAIRSLTGLQGRVLPEVRNVGGAAWVFTFTLYPYVYVLVRAALGDRAVHLMEAAQVLGAPLRRRILEIALPMARPALTAGVALALMETLADFGVGSYFGIQTFTTGIFKAWLSMDDRHAAALLATALFALVALLLAAEQAAQRRLRYASARPAGAPGLHGRGSAEPVQLQGRRAALAVGLCMLPVMLGFVLPVLFMFRPLVADWAVLPWQHFVQWGRNSLGLGLLTAAAACAIALSLAHAQRHTQRTGAAPRAWRCLVHGAARLLGLGYAVPGAVLVLGLLLPLKALQTWAPQWQAGYWITATVAGLLWAYLARYSAVALQSIQSGYARLPLSLDESAQLLGVQGGALFRRVHWPLLGRSTAAAALLVLVDVMKELPATLVLRPFNTDTLAVAAYQLARDERLGEAALPCLALVLVGLLPVLLLNRAMQTR
jgi:iron(III) transport system permease protein